MKRMTAIYEGEYNSNNNNGPYYKTYICSKGVPESLLLLCSHYVDNDGRVIDITEDYKRKILNYSRIMSGESNRVILLAYK